MFSWAEAPSVSNYWYYPGDVVRMSCGLNGSADSLRLTVALIKRGEIGIAAGAPEPSNETEFVTDFSALGFTPGASFTLKRVNAIDQSGNEGNEVQPTTAYAAVL